MSLVVSLNLRAKSTRRQRLTRVRSSLAYRASRDLSCSLIRFFPSIARTVMMVS